jgi:hypothetical protein
MPLPARTAPISTTFAGSAQTMPVMKTVCASVKPASSASAAKPIKLLARISAGTDIEARHPRPNHFRRVEKSGAGASTSDSAGEGMSRR